MATISATLARRVARNHGIVTTTQLTSDGLSWFVIRREVTAGRLVRLHPGVFRMATSPDTFESRCRAACAADPEIVVTGLAAGRLWEFRHIHPVDRPIVMVPHDRTPVSRGATLRRTKVIAAEDTVRRRDGIVVASPPRAWFECARDSSDVRFERLTEWVLDHHVKMPTLWRTVRRLGARGRPGSARVRRVMSQRSDWQRPAGSGLELRVLKALESQGVRHLVRQHRIELPSGAIIHADGADPDIRWAVEVDHVTWHGGRFEAQRDKARDRAARRVGWQVDRVTDQELDDNFDAAISDLVALHALRSSEFGTRQRSSTS